MFNLHQISVVFQKLISNILHLLLSVDKMAQRVWLRVIACNSGTQMRVRDSSATRIFFLKNRMMQHRAQNITTKFWLHLSFRLAEKKY